MIRNSDFKERERERERERKERDGGINENVVNRVHCTFLHQKKHTHTNECLDTRVVRFNKCGNFLLSNTQ